MAEPRGDPQPAGNAGPGGQLVGLTDVPDPLEGRAVWSDADFEQMGWHDATVWAVAFLATDPRETLDSSGELALDIDYIVQWIEPVPPDGNVRLRDRLDRARRT